ncbi:hypothetical protein [Calothrix sp. 336/3]|uniref:hypothetical protein n=1 Tax=Calothrix sp. 336/3 TaxID=1337936 RepID=UPI0004E3DA71|nr:hypothetical protein [Calothrix sp. 336/3]AKG21361.1 hypothetical protein IJ00_08700 [Calothrix sp. 336/3]
MKFATTFFFTILSLSSITAISSTKTYAVTPNTQVIVQERRAPVTYMTRRNSNQIAIRIKEGEFKFQGILKRTKGNMYIAEDRQVRVMYDLRTKRVVVINKKTGTEYYNYIFSMKNEGAL